MNGLQEIISTIAFVATIGSYHFDEKREVEWFNPGLGIEAQVTDRVYVGAGGYRNSFGDATGYMGAGIHLTKLGPVTVGAELAKAWGYDEYEYIGGLALSLGERGAKAIINPEIIGLQYRF